MKNLSTLLFTMILLFKIAQGQGNFEIGTNVINAGLGFGDTYGTGISSGSGSPTIYAGYECGIWSIDGPGIISLGGLLAYKSFSDDVGVYESNLSATLLGFRGAYHYNGIKSNKYDVYGGLMLGLRFVSFSTNVPNYFYDGNDTDLVLSFFLGGRYYFNDIWAVNVELGSGISVLSLGVSYKF